MSIAAALRKSQESLELLTQLVRSQTEKPDVEFERLLDGYLEARRSLARQFSLIAQAYLLRNGTLLETTRKRIEQRMTESLAGRIPDKHLAVRGYRSVQPVLLEYLAQHVGKPVRSSKLRILTGDQTHTERRVRDLRDLGFVVDWKKVADDDQYILKSTEADLDAAVILQVRRNINGDKKLAKQDKERLLHALQ